MNRIKLDKRNYRKHPDRNKELIAKSLKECGAGRSILIDNDDTIIAGNGVFEQAEKMNMPVRVVETTGEELLVVKRTDLTKDSPERTKIAVYDNKTTDTSIFDFDLIIDDFTIDELHEFGFENDEIEFMTDSDLTIIENNELDKSSPDHFYGSNSRVFRFGNLITYLTDEKIISDLDKFTDKIIEFDETQKYHNEIGHAIAKFIIENENIFLSKDKK